MMTFKKEHSNFARIKQEPEETITVTTSSEGLYEVLAAFERFLQGCGYTFDGHLEFVNDFDEGIPEGQDQYISKDGSEGEWPFPIAKKP